MEKIILFYKFINLNDPLMVMLWQQEVCSRLNLKGRIIIAKHGINGTLGGNQKDLRLYIKSMNRVDEFNRMQYKWSNGSRDDFPKLSIKVRNELVTLEPDEPFDVFNRGTPLTPQQWHNYLESHKGAIVLDARNEYESEIGTFKNAINPKIKVFKEIKSKLNALPKDKPILTYCTGDIRCEYLSAYMKHKGFKKVYHLQGGIMKYGQKFGDAGYWQGKCYVFDKRMKLAFSQNSKDIGKCSRCGEITSDHKNCNNLKCNRLILLCQACFQTRPFCSIACRQAPVSVR